MKTATAPIQITLAVPPIQFVSRRATAYGIEYQTADQHTTTVSGTSSTCSCGIEHYAAICMHRLAAMAQEHAYAEQAQRRAAYCAEFAIY